MCIEDYCGSYSFFRRSSREGLELHFISLPFFHRMKRIERALCLHDASVLLFLITSVNAHCTPVNNRLLSSNPTSFPHIFKEYLGRMNACLPRDNANANSREILQTKFGTKLFLYFRNPCYLAQTLRMGSLLQVVPGDRRARIALSPSDQRPLNFVVLNYINRNATVSKFFAKSFAQTSSLRRSSLHYTFTFSKISSSASSTLLRSNFTTSPCLLPPGHQMFQVTASLALGGLHFSQRSFCASNS